MGSSSLALAALVSCAPALLRAQTVTRGPYLQLGTPSSIVVRWRTDLPSDARVRYGPDPLQLTQSVDDPTSTTEHEVLLSALSPETRYYYSIGTSGAALAGGDPDHYFKTHPLRHAARPIRLWALGDSGTTTTLSFAVRDSFLAFTGSRTPDLWLMLGDNAYSDGTDDQYQQALFDKYPTMLRRSVLWPSFGNHDSVSSKSDAQTGPYFESFTLPTAGEAGGVASGTEAYYSFDYGNIHFICLDSQGSKSLPESPMLTWLAADLAAAQDQTWIIGFWHHPPYTKGTHDSDDETDSGGILEDIRNHAVAILEAGGVDLVLNGHSHNYERSFLLDGHYAKSDTLTAAMILDGGDGRVGGDGYYIKPLDLAKANQGAVYLICGGSGRIPDIVPPLDHPAMFLSLHTMGSVVVDVDGYRLDVLMLNENAQIIDSFGILKSSHASVDASHWRRMNR